MAVNRKRWFNSKQIAICSVFGGGALALRASNIVIPIGGPFVIDARGIPGAVGAALSGPIGGIVVGILAGLAAKIPIIDIPSFTTAYIIIGLLAWLLKKYKWLSGLGALAGYPVAAFIAWQIGFFPDFFIAIGAVAPRMVVIPVQLFVLYAVFKRWPNIIEFVKK